MLRAAVTPRVIIDVAAIPQLAREDQPRHPVDREHAVSGLEHTEPGRIDHRLSYEHMVA